MTIKVGDRLPEATFMVSSTDGPQPRTTSEVFKGRKVILFGVPGAFTPTATAIICLAFSRIPWILRTRGSRRFA